MKNLILALGILVVVSSAYAESIQPEVIATFNISEQDTPPSPNSVKLSCGDMGCELECVFSISSDESILLIDTGYGKFLSISPASGTPISTIELPKAYELEGFYNNREFLANDMENAFRRYDAITGQLLEESNFPLPDICWRFEHAISPRFYFDCDEHGYFSYDPVTHVVSEITKSDIYPREEIIDYLSGGKSLHKKKIHINSTTAVEINPSEGMIGRFLGVDNANNIYIHESYVKWKTISF